MKLKALVWCCSLVLYCLGGNTYAETSKTQPRAVVDQELPADSSDTVASDDFANNVTNDDGQVDNNTDGKVDSTMSYDNTQEPATVSPDNSADASMSDDDY